MIGACEAQQGRGSPEMSGMRHWAHPAPAFSEQRLTVPSPRPLLTALGGGGYRLAEAVNVVHVAFIRVCARAIQAVHWDVQTGQRPHQAAHFGVDCSLHTVAPCLSCEVQGVHLMPSGC